MKKYDDTHVVVLRRMQLANLAATTAQLAEMFEVTEGTIYAWMEKHDDFRVAVEVLRARANAKVEAALFKKATGYTKKVQKISRDGELVELEEEVPADNASMVFWLKNRAKSEWRDTVTSEISGAGGAPLPMINITLNTMRGQETIIPAVDMTKATGGSVDYHRRKQKLLAEERQKVFKPKVAGQPSSGPPPPPPPPPPEPSAPPSPPDVAVQNSTNEEDEFEDYDEADYK